MRTRNCRGDMISILDSIRTVQKILPTVRVAIDLLFAVSEASVVLSDNELDC